MVIPDDLKVTTEVLLRGALIFAVIDFLFVSILTRIIKHDDLFKMKWNLVIIMCLFFCVLFGSVMSIIFWDSVYSYVFPPWARWLIPPSYGVLFAFVGLLFWWIATRVRKISVITFCLLGGLWGVITHILAIQRGILDKPPMLIGSSPIAALTIAFFEFIFYWCICLSVTRLFLLLKSNKNSKP